MAAAESFQEEKWFGQASLLEIIQRPTWRRDVVALPSSSSDWENWHYLFVGKRTLMENYSSVMDAYIAEARKPYVNAQAVPQPTDPLTRALVSQLPMRHFDFARSETGASLMITALALRAYKLEHGTYPESLKMLVPAYLRAVPTDPFGTSTLRYKKQGAIYLLWSIGPDKKDDGGQPIPIESPNTTLFRSEYLPNSAPQDAKAQGDWVIRLPQTSAR